MLGRALGLLGSPEAQALAACDITNRSGVMIGEFVGFFTVPASGQVLFWAAFLGGGWVILVREQ